MVSKTRRIGLAKRCLLTHIVILILLIWPFCSGQAGPVPLALKLGPMANYGATPWFTKDIALGRSPMDFTLDTGSNFIWATSDRCGTPACQPHPKVDTTQSSWHWIDRHNTTRSFGPWGSITTWTGQIRFIADIPHAGFSKDPLNLYAATNYTKPQFQYLNWGGGIGFPSDSTATAPCVSFFFGSVNPQLDQPIFSTVTYPKQGNGYFYLGAENEIQLLPESRMRLPPHRSGSVGYLWGTKLYEAYIGDQPIQPLMGGVFYLDTGSSLFKGDSRFVKPILENLYAIVDRQGERIFDKVYDDQLWVSLVYRKGGPDQYKGLLPALSLTIGRNIANNYSTSVRIVLSPEQYSYYVEKGHRSAKKWVPAFTILDGVGGLLVGSVFMDLFYTTFTYSIDAGNAFRQGEMYLYLKSDGTRPEGYTFVETPSAGIRQGIAGTWYNSYCSQVVLTLDPAGKLNGTYTSHTGSVGSSAAVGNIGRVAPRPKAAVDAAGGVPINPSGVPFSMGIQWRLINEKVTNADASWHWISLFSGQYHPAQIVRQDFQDDYRQPETLEILNGLIATAPVAGLADVAPVLWPQTLQFHRTPPAYCRSVQPPKPVPFRGNAKDNVSGKWHNPTHGEISLAAKMETGRVSGTYVRPSGDKYTVTGLVDAIAADTPPGVKLVQQGLTLTMADSERNVLNMAGGVNLAKTAEMILWIGNLRSTTWVDRFTELTLEKTKWVRKKEF